MRCWPRQGQASDLQAGRLTLSVCCIMGGPHWAGLETPSEAKKAAATRGRDVVGGFDVGTIALAVDSLNPAQDVKRQRCQVSVLGGWQDSRRLRISPSLPPSLPRGTREEWCGPTSRQTPFLSSARHSALLGRPRPSRLTPGYVPSQKKYLPW